ncbi:MAG TPA: ASCH domain-containing protein [Streptosporangiaceae bacterium]|jgi:uncharacterized protein YhfF
MTDQDEIARLPITEFGFPGPLRDRLVGAVLSGAKTATTGLLADYRICADPLPRAGARTAMVDSAGVRVAVLETTDVRVMPLGDVGVAHARAEGEGYATVAAWRAAHEEFWHGAEMRAALGDPGFTVDDSTEVVCERFRVAADLRQGLGG